MSRLHPLIGSEFAHFMNRLSIRGRRPKLPLHIVVKRSIINKMHCTCRVFTLLFLPLLFAKCRGKFINPLTDIQWSCLLPMTIGGKNVTPGKKDYEKYGGLPVCSCPGVPPKFGIKVSFFEPTRLVDVTRIPYCLVGLGGISVSQSTVRKHGTIRVKEDSSRASFYNVHWYIYPLIYWLKLLTDFECV